MNIERFAAKGPAPYGKHDATMLDDFTVAVDRAMVTQHKAIGTTQLVRLMQSQPSDAQMKSLIGWLRLARAEGKLEGYYTQGKPTAGTFGKPRIFWLLSAEKREEIEEYMEFVEPR